MHVKILNERQAWWAVRLAAFDFVITHRLSKTNPADAPSRCSDYVKATDESISRLLSTLQRKLAAMPATMPKSLMIISCLETICQACKEQIDMRSKEPQLSWHTLRGLEDRQLLVHCEHSIVKSLNPAAETVDCRQLVSHVLVSGLTSHKTAYNDSSGFFLFLVCSLQMNNPFIQAQKTEIAKEKCSCDTESLRWAFDSTKLLCYEERLYIPPEASV